MRIESHIIITITTVGGRGRHMRDAQTTVDVLVPRIRGAQMNVGDRVRLYEGTLMAAADRAVRHEKLLVVGDRHPHVEDIQMIAGVHAVRPRRKQTMCKTGWQECRLMQQPSSKSAKIGSGKGMKRMLVRLPSIENRTEGADLWQAYTAKRARWTWEIESHDLEAITARMISNIAFLPCSSMVEKFYWSDTPFEYICILHTGMTYKYREHITNRLSNR